MTEPVKVIPYGGPSADVFPPNYKMPDTMVYSFVDDDGKIIGPLVVCKGYINNKLYGSIIDADTLGWMYSKVDGKVNLESTRILLARGATTPEVFEKEVKLAIDLVNSLEKELGLMRSTYYLTTGITSRQAILVVGSKRWMLAPPMINLYIWLLRNGLKHTMGHSYMDVVSADANITQTVKHIVENKYWNVFGKDIKKNWPNGINQLVMNEMGCQWFAKASWQPTFKSHFPHWKLISEQELKVAA